MNRPQGGLLQRGLIVDQVPLACLTKDSKAIVCGVNCCSACLADLARH